MKAIAAVVLASFVVVSACATGTSNNGEDAGTGDTGVGKDAGTDGNGGNDTGTQDTGGGKDVIDTCVKAPPSNVCGVFPQCDCPSNQTCEVDQTKLDGSSSCVIAGTKTTGQACTATTGQCAPGLTCIWGECRPYCGTAGSTCSDPLTSTCINLTNSSMADIPNLLVCHINCALQDPNACAGTGEGCIYFATDTVDCYPVGTSTTCSSSQPECKAGDVCVYDGVSTYTCYPWCRIGGSDCTSGICNAFGTPPTVNSQQYGYCH